MGRQTRRDTSAPRQLASGKEDGLLIQLSQQTRMGSCSFLLSCHVCFCFAIASLFTGWRVISFAVEVPSIHVSLLSILIKTRFCKGKKLSPVFSLHLLASVNAPRQHIQPCARVSKLESTNCWWNFYEIRPRLV